jgi:hypothetical protein
VLIPNTLTVSHDTMRKCFSLREGLAVHQLVGGVTAHQGYDG